MLNVTKPHIFLARYVQTKYCKVCRPRVALHCLRDASITNQDKQNTRAWRRDRCTVNCVLCANVSWQLQNPRLKNIWWKRGYKYNLWQRMYRMCSTDTVEHQPGGAGPGQRSASWIISQIIVTINQLHGTEQLHITPSHCHVTTSFSVTRPPGDGDANIQKSVFARTTRS